MTDNPVVANAISAMNAASGGATAKEFDGCVKGAIADIRRQCSESLATVDAQGKRLMEFAARQNSPKEWAAIVDKRSVFEGLVKSILRDLDHAASR